MADAPATFLWRNGALAQAELDPHERLLVAESFFVSPDGRARAIEAHHERFLDAVQATGAPSDADAFWGPAIGRLRSFREAALFPRIELAQLESGRREFRLRVRPAPRLRESTVLSTFGGPDPRTAPRVKGPDLERLIALRALAQENGADETVLLHDGLVVDGTSAALLWWRGETLVAPAGDLARVASVTARSIRLIASATGTSVVEERVTPAQLEGCEVWVVNALHGITVVERWIDGPAVSVRRSRAATWRRRLAALSRRV